MILKCFIEIRVFLSIILMMNLIMTVAFLSQYTGNYYSEKDFTGVFGDFYLFLNGESPYEAEMNRGQWLIYIIFTMMNIIVSLNLLIAILSDKYDEI